MATKAASKRLAKEYKAMVENPPPFITARPSERNILEWHYVLTGPPDTPYADGQYHGLIVFPRDYPFKPPQIRMVTPNGRFATNTRLCLSMSDYHPDTWQPAWSVATILTGLLSFMTGVEPTTGSIATTDEMKRKFARASLEFNAKNNAGFMREFPEMVKTNLEQSAQVAQKQKLAREQQKKELEAQKQKETAERENTVNLDKLDPEDRIRYLAAQKKAALNGNVAGQARSYWAYYALAIAVLVGFFSIVN